MTKYSEKLFLHLYKTSKTPVDLCICGSDLIAQDVLQTLYKHGISMHVICDNEISASRFILTSHDDLAKFPDGGQN